MEHIIWVNGNMIRETAWALFIIQMDISRWGYGKMASIWMTPKRITKINLKIRQRCISIKIDLYLYY